MSIVGFFESFVRLVGASTRQNLESSAQQGYMERADWRTWRVSIRPLLAERLALFVFLILVDIEA